MPTPPRNVLAPFAMKAIVTARVEAVQETQAAITAMHKQEISYDKQQRQPSPRLLLFSLNLPYPTLILSCGIRNECLLFERLSYLQNSYRYLYRYHYTTTNYHYHYHYDNSCFYPTFQYLLQMDSQKKISCLLLFLLLLCSSPFYFLRNGLLAWHCHLINGTKHCR